MLVYIMIRSYRTFKSKIPTHLKRKCVIPYVSCNIDKRAKSNIIAGEVYVGKNTEIFPEKINLETEQPFYLNGLIKM